MDPRGEAIWIPLLAGAAIGAGIDLGLQLWMNGGDIHCVDWSQVGMSGAMGAAGGLAFKGIGLGLNSWRAAAQTRAANQALINAGKRYDRNGMSVAGRAAQKHGSRPTNYPRPANTAAGKNQQGQDLLEQIILSNSRRTRPNRYGGTDYFDNVSGRGARYDGNGNFIGFL